MNQDAIKNIRHNNNFDLIRLLLAGLVILSHSWKFVEGNYAHEPIYFLTGNLILGDLAVYGFFLLSGYLIFASWIKKPQITEFIFKRCLRIFPGFVVVSVLSVMLGSVVYKHEFLSYLLRWRVLFDAFSLGEPIGPFKGEVLNISLWTIRYEFFCYVMVCVMGFIGLLKKKWPITVMWIISLVIFACGFVVDKSLVGSFIRFIPFFITGGIFYIYSNQIKFCFLYAVIAVVVIFLALFNETLLRVVLPIFGGYFLFYVGFFKCDILKKIKPKNDISYGLYLYGWPIQKILATTTKIGSPWVFCVVSFLVAALFGFLSWRLVEEPSLRLKTSKSVLFKHFFKRTRASVSSSN